MLQEVCERQPVFLFSSLQLEMAKSGRITLHEITNANQMPMSYEILTMLEIISYDNQTKIWRDFP